MVVVGLAKKNKNKKRDDGVIEYEQQTKVSAQNKQEQVFPVHIEQLGLCSQQQTPSITYLTVYLKFQKSYFLNPHLWEIEKID